MSYGQLATHKKRRRRSSLDVRHTPPVHLLHCFPIKTSHYTVLQVASVTYVTCISRFYFFILVTFLRF